MKKLRKKFYNKAKKKAAPPPPGKATLTGTGGDTADTSGNGGSDYPASSSAPGSTGGTGGAGEGMPHFSNPILANAEKSIESKLLPNNLGDYRRIVIAGMRFALAGGPNSLMAKIKTSKNLMNDIPKGAIGIILTINREFRFSMPPRAMVPAMYVLMLEGFDFAERLGMIQVNQDTLVQATHVFTNFLVHDKLGISPQRFTSIASKVHGVMNDPTKMEILARRSGVVKAPGASETSGIVSGGAPSGPPPGGLINQGGA